MKKYVMLIIILLLVIEGCSKKSIVRKYYLLEFQNETTTETTTKAIVNQGCEIFPVTVPPAFAQSRIAVRIKSHEINYYSNHQWAVTPGDILTKLIETHVQGEHIFSKASQTVWQSVPRFQIQSEVYQIEATDDEDDLFAHLSMKLDLYDRSENRIIVSHSFDRIEILEARDLNLLAAKLSDILKEELRIFTYRIKKYLTGNLEVE